MTSATKDSLGPVAGVSAAALKRIEPGVYSDKRGDRYVVKRLGDTETGRTAYTIKYEKAKWDALVITGQAINHPLLPAALTSGLSSRENPIYGVSNKDWAEPFCLGAPISLATVGPGVIRIEGYRKIIDSSSRTCPFSDSNSLQSNPSHTITLNLVTQDESGSSPEGMFAKGLVPGEYGDMAGQGQHLFKLTKIKSDKGRSLWKFEGGDKRNNFQGVSGTFIEGSPKGHPLFSQKGFSLQMPDGLIYGQLKRGFGSDPFCDGSVAALMPVANNLELISFTVLTDPTSRTCTFAGPTHRVKEAATSSFALKLIKAYGN